MTEPEAWAAHLPPHGDSKPMTQIDTSTALLPCPFCGVHLRYAEPVAYVHPVGKCILSGRNFHKGRIGQWDRRALVPALVAEKDDLRAKLDAAVEALEGSREIILGLVNSRGSEAEGTDEDWVGEIDAALARVKGGV